MVLSDASPEETTELAEDLTDEAFSPPPGLAAPMSPSEPLHPGRIEAVDAGEVRETLYRYLGVLYTYE